MAFWSHFGALWFGALWFGALWKRSQHIAPDVPGLDPTLIHTDPPIRSRQTCSGSQKGHLWPLEPFRGPMAPPDGHSGPGKWCQHIDPDVPGLDPTLIHADPPVWSRQTCLWPQKGHLWPFGAILGPYGGLNKGQTYKIRSAHCSNIISKDVKTNKNVCEVL